MRRLLFFTGQRMLAYHWSRNRFRAAHVFEADAQGLQDFERFLQAAPKKPVRLIIDIIEEGFRIDTMPRTFGGDRAAVSQRVLAKHFRTTIYRHLIVQGRQRRGRRDFRVMVSGLTNPEMLNVWVDMINRSKVPLEGIYSMPLIGEKLLPYLKAQRDFSLIITQQSPGAVRQSFYKRGNLQLSRLVPIRYEGDEGYAGFINREVHNMLRFLESQRVVRRNTHMNVHIISPIEHLAELQRGLRNEEVVTYDCWDYRSVAKKLRIRGELPTEFADGLFAQLLARESWPQNHYAAPHMRTHHFHRFTRMALHAASVLVLIGAALLSGTKLIEGRLYESYSLEARVETSQYQRLYDQLLREISNFPLKAAYVKDAVDLVRELDDSIQSSPHNLLALLGDVLNRHPGVTVTEVMWVSDADADVTPEAARQSGRSSREATFEAGKRYEIAQIRGHVTEFGRSYRGAIDLFDDFVRELKRDERFGLVTVQRTPFDIDPQASLSGDSGTSAAQDDRDRAAYELLVRVKHENDDV